MTKSGNISFTDIHQFESETTQQWVYRALRHIIMSGQITPGRALTIRGLAADLGVSAMPVREALRRLTSEGALELKSNRRIMVPDLTPSKLAEIFEMRVALETFAAERALPYIDDEKLESLIEIDELLNKYLLEGDPTSIIITNQEFHRQLYSANPNPVSLPLIERIWLQIGPIHHLALVWLKENYMDDRHIDIINALKERDPYSLKAAIEADIREAAGYLAQRSLLKDYFDHDAEEMLQVKDFTIKLQKKAS